MTVRKVREHVEGRNVDDQWKYIPNIPEILILRHAHANRSPYFIAAGS
jgi:hypothetical protein